MFVLESEGTDPPPDAPSSTTPLHWTPRDAAVPCASVRECSLSVATSATSLARPPSRRPSGACRSYGRGRSRALRTSTEHRERENLQERSLRPLGSPPPSRRRDPR